MAKLKIGKTLLFFVVISSAHAEPTAKLTVVATPNPVAESESVQLRLEVVADGAIRTFPPEFQSEEFTIAGSGSSGGQTSVYENGKISAQTRMIFTYMLFPKKTGILSIKNIRVRVGNESLTSPDLKIKVEPDGSGRTSQQQTPQEEEDDSNPAAPGSFQGGQQSPGRGAGGAGLKDLPSSFNSDFTVHAAFSKKSAYVGEPIIVEYYIYDFGGVRQLEIQKWPTFNGFWKDDLEMISRFNFEDVYVGNRPMRRTFVGRYALFGLKPGKFTVDKLVIRGRYLSRASFPGMDDDDPISLFMGGGALATGIHASQEMTLEILPLPDQGRPEKFGGAVGKFDLKITADKTTVAANNPITLTTTVEGRGNFQAIEGIKIPLPPEFELYETTTQPPPAIVAGARRSLDSKKSFQTIIIPRKAGNYQIPAVKWHYFDPEKKSYQTISTTAIDLTITESAAGAGPTNSYLTDSAKHEPVKQEELRDLKSGSPFRTTKDYLTWLIYAAIAVNLLLVLRLARSKRNVIKSAIRRLDPLQSAKNSLRKVHGSKTWHNDLEETVNEILEALLKTNPRGVTRGELQSLWRENNLPHELFQKIESLLSQLDQERFAHGAANKDAQKAKLIKSAEEILKAAGKIL